MSGSAFAVTHHAFSSGAGRTSDGNGSHASTLKSPSYTKSVSWQHYQAPELHKSIGILLMMGLVIRVLWRVISPPPGPLPSYSPMTRLAAKAGHLALYLLLFAIGISGYLISTADGKPISVFGWFDVPATLADAGAQADFAGALHFWLAWSVVVLSVMHGFMALKHHFIDKDDTLKRMLGKSSSDYGV
ncbi:hypothetical protein AC93_1190 [Escherichia coli 2-005-03_S4_C2]|nr:cytochrome b [Escherichia coli]EZJ53161.1 hypothetical protein AC93_1190 [Escherichia coli 2-005-03_S4_C2]KDT28715.1 prokaryotic cytochrome b561 family protein [Escherichia coli 2-052-05_S4_C1]